ncbi:MAG: glycosyltransferase [Nitrososphaerota archaeon]|nr:glycosyltransferase [Nitrososphaerota archaeon]
MSDTSVDVLVVTKNDISPEFEEMIKEAVPVHEIIVEKSYPLGPARERAIQRSSTDRFVWLDDDVYLPQGWYDSLMAFWNDAKIGWLESLAVPSTPPWYAQWSHWRFAKDVAKRTVWDLGPNERSFNCCAIVKRDALSDWHYPAGEYLGFGSEDLLMSAHVTDKGYRRLRVAIECEHRLAYGDTQEFWSHIRKGVKGLAGVPQYHNLKTALRNSGACVLSGVEAGFATGNLSITANSIRWGWYWFRGLAF